ncbi:MAG: toxin-antitoxin system TumE family protein [Candidatus Baldrarchaeia archaeon]
MEVITPMYSPYNMLLKIRILFRDGSFLDVYWSESGKYSLHYERRYINGTVYRYDNAPHLKHHHIRTSPPFPLHQRE